MTTLTDYEAFVESKLSGRSRASTKDRVNRVEGRPEQRKPSHYQLGDMFS